MVAWTPVGVLRIVRSGHIVGRMLGVLGTGSLDVVCEWASIERKFEYTYRICECFLILLNYRNNWKKSGYKEIMLFLCFIIIFSVPFAHFMCEAICITPFMDQISIYEYIKNQFQDSNAVYCCCHLMFIAIHLYNYNNWLCIALILVWNRMLTD